jgi:hypothetical protein
MIKFKPDEEKELGRIQLDEYNDLVIRKVKVENQINIDLRIFLKTKNYSGLTPKGIYLNIDKLDKLIDILKSGKNV